MEEVCFQNICNNNNKMSLEGKSTLINTIIGVEEKRIHADTSGLKDYSWVMPTYISLLRNKMVGEVF